MEYLFDLLLLAVVFWLGKKYQTWNIMADIYNDPDHYINLAQKVKEMKKEDLVTVVTEDKSISTTEVRSEQIDNTVYLYDATTGEFLAQAENCYRAMLLAAERNPNKRFRHNPNL